MMQGWQGGRGVMHFGNQNGEQLGMRGTSEGHLLGDAALAPITLPSLSETETVAGE